VVFSSVHLRSALNRKESLAHASGFQMLRNRGFGIVSSSYARQSVVFPLSGDSGSLSIPSWRSTSRSKTKQANS
jgi:hypothetical protein